MIYMDCETVGFYGPIVLIQYAEDDSEIKLYCPWEHKVNETLELFRWMAYHEGGVCGFNLVFDWFHVCQMFTTLDRLQQAGYGDDHLGDLIEEYAEHEMLARDGPCIKPQTACDIMLHARRGPYQSTMDRHDIRIKRVPTCIAFQLAKELDKKIPLKDIYFKRKKTYDGTKWQVYDIKNSDAEINPDFKDVVLKFSASTALKALAVDALGVEQDKVLLFQNIDIDAVYYPKEYGFAPFAKAVGCRGKWNGAWPEVIEAHISHWLYHKLAREYAGKDVEYTRDLYKYFGSPKPGDNDSILACAIAAIRWKGFKIDLAGIKKLREKAFAKKNTEYRGQIINTPTAPRQVRFYVGEVLNETERAAAKLDQGTSKAILEELSKLTKDCDCVIRPTFQMDAKMSFDQQMAAMLAHSESGKANPDCPNCKGTGKKLHPAAQRAKKVLDARKADKEIELYDKLLIAGRLHASFRVIGTLSSRMSGSDKLNAQAIKKDENVRACFPLAGDGYSLDGGDFSSFEITLAEADYNDAQLRETLLSTRPCHDCKAIGKIDDKLCPTCKGKQKVSVKIHALFGECVYKGHSYEEILKSEKKPHDMYTGAKRAVFLRLYGGEAKKLSEALNVSIEDAQHGIEEFDRRYPGVKKAQQRIVNMFQSMKQPGGIGTQVIWHEPCDKILSMFGFPRYFTLENMIAKALFLMANSPPPAWRDLKIKLTRRDKIQTAGGAAQSALYGAAFQIQAAITRAAINHVIQSSGATITKDVQCEVWKFQPAGVSEWIVYPMQIHDEIQCPTKPEYSQRVKEAVLRKVEDYRPKVPLIKMDWVIGMQTWADKG